MKEKIKIVFFWTWDFSANILKSLLNDFKNKIDIKFVVSQPNKPVWRKKVLEKTPVKIVAEENNIECLQPEKLRKNIDFFEKLNSLNLDFIVVVAYWKIVPKEVWASPIQESIKLWDKKTWLTIMYMSEGMDEWDILAIEKVEIWKNDKTSDIFKKFEEIWPELLVNTLKLVLDWKIKWQKQDDSKTSYCSKIKKEDWEVKIQKETWKQIYNKFRAYYPWPGIYSYYFWKKINFEDVNLKNYLWNKSIWEVDKLSKKDIWIICRDKKILLLKKVKLEWKKSMDILSFVNGNKDFLDYKFN